MFLSFCANFNPSKKFYSFKKPSFNRYPRKIDSSNFQCITKKERITLKEGKSIENRNKQEQNDDNNNQSIFVSFIIIFIHIYLFTFL